MADTIPNRIAGSNGINDSVGQAIVVRSLGDWRRYDAAYIAPTTRPSIEPDGQSQWTEWEAQTTSVGSIADLRRNLMRVLLAEPPCGQPGKRCGYVALRFWLFSLA